jgi:hypothetical protein
MRLNSAGTSPPAGAWAKEVAAKAAKRIANNAFFIFYGVFGFPDHKYRKLFDNTICPFDGITLDVQIRFDSCSHYRKTTLTKSCKTCKDFVKPGNTNTFAS